MKRRIRRIRRIRRALKRAGLYNAFRIALIAVLLTGFCVILFNVKEPEQQEEKPETTQAEWHTDRMQKLNCTDLMNPYQNVKVGIDFLSYLLKKYGTVQDALAAYNYGERGAREHLWNNGVYVYSYNTAIMQRMKEIEEVVGK